MPPSSYPSPTSLLARQKLRYNLFALIVWFVALRSDLWRTIVKLGYGWFGSPLGIGGSYGLSGVIGGLGYAVFLSNIAVASYYIYGRPGTTTPPPKLVNQPSQQDQNSKPQNPSSSNTSTLPSILDPSFPGLPPNMTLPLLRNRTRQGQGQEAQSAGGGSGSTGGQGQRQIEGGSNGSGNGGNSQVATSSSGQGQQNQPGTSTTQQPSNPTSSSAEQPPAHIPLSQLLTPNKPTSRLSPSNFALQTPPPWQGLGSSRSGTSSSGIGGSRLGPSGRRATDDISPNRPPVGSSSDINLGSSAPTRTISRTSPSSNNNVNTGRKTIHAHQSQTVGLDPLSVSVYKMKMAAGREGVLGRSQLRSSYGYGSGSGGYGNDRTGFDLGTGFDGVEEFGYGVGTRA